MRTDIVYIENKLTLNGPARIARVTWTKSRRGVRYGELLLQSSKGHGFKSNYFDSETGDEYWVSRPRKDGLDRLYPGIVEIDDDASEEYWTRIRRQPDLVGQSRYRSEGKHRR